MDADWGWDEPPHPLAREFRGASPLEKEELPEVRQLTAEGWELLEDAPVYVFLPCVWPRSARTWVPDRSTRYTTEWTAPGQVGRRVPWSREIFEEWEADANQDLALAGLPPRPPDRLWLLRPVGGFPSFQALLDYLWNRADATGLPLRLSPEFVRFSSEELRHLTAGE